MKKTGILVLMMAVLTATLSGCGGRRRIGRGGD